jgi:hypothetical protein
MQNILKPNLQTDTYNRSCILQMKYINCLLKYIRQTGRTLNIRFKKHVHSMRSNNSNNGYSNHTLITGHTYPMDITSVTVEKKGKPLNT